MDVLLQSVVTRSVSVEDINPNSLQNDVLDELSRLTGTVIQHDKTARVSSPLYRPSFNGLMLIDSSNSKSHELPKVTYRAARTGKAAY